MEASTVWNTWRRILCDDNLVGIVTRQLSRDPLDGGDLDAEQSAIVAGYGQTPEATSTNVGMYRRGLMRLAQVALGRVPMSHRLVQSSALDTERLLADFTRENGYADDGPNFWRLAAKVVSHLAALPTFSAKSFQEVFALDLALASLCRRLGTAPPTLWPNEALGRFAPPEGSELRYRISDAATVVRTSLDLTAWIEDPFGFDASASLPAGPKCWLLYVPHAEIAPAYAEVSDRTARVLGILHTPSTLAEIALAIGDLSEGDVFTVLTHLAELGVVLDGRLPCPDEAVKRVDDLYGASPDDDVFVYLDPAVELLAGEVAEHRLLCHTHMGVGMAIPPGDGLAEFVLGLAKTPVSIGVLRAGHDDRHLVDVMLSSLTQHGFLHFTGPSRPDAAMLEQLRAVAQNLRCPRLSHSLAFRMGEVTAVLIRDHIAEQAVPPELHLHGHSPADHAALLLNLADFRSAGLLKLHRLFIHLSDLVGVAAVMDTLTSLGSEIVLVGLRWPIPEVPLDGLELLSRARIPVYACMCPDISLLNPIVQAQAARWATDGALTGLFLTLDPDVLWPQASPCEADFLAAFEAVLHLEELVGDVVIANLPGDEVLLGNAAPLQPASLSAEALALRTSYLRWRLPLLKLAEGDNTFSQTPESEEKLVRNAEDLLPQHPELLQIVPGSWVVDVCGGNGRVARRLSPLVSTDGKVISIEMLRSVTDRARRFAVEQGFSNIQFRTGRAERLPLPEGSVDAVVNEWTGAIWELGLGNTVLQEMARIVRRGGRVAVTHRLVRLPLLRLDQPWVQFADIYELMQTAFRQSGLKIVSERIWGMTVQSLAGERATSWRKQYLPRLVNPFEVTYTTDLDPSPSADVCLTIIAERVS